MRSSTGVLVLTLFLTTFAVAAVQGCNSDCDDEADRAAAFLNSHQSCQTNDDCVVVGDYCGHIPGGFCGQLSMNRSGAESAEWRAIAQDLADCTGEETCQTCLAALVPTCTAGSCSRR
jgi:hypothetical protein